MTFPPNGRSAPGSNAAKYKEMYDRSLTDPQGFWAEHGKRIHWFTPYSKVKNTSFDTHDVSIKWFEDGVTNVAYNCIDRHLPKRASQTAIIWEGDDPSKSKHITYAELADRVGHLANVLKGHGVKKGDRVTIYLPMIPEAAYAMLACARIGAIHSVVFGGFSADALAGRIADAKSEHRHHRGRRPARRAQGAAEGQCRRRDRKGRRRQDGDRRQAHRRRGRLAEWARRLAA